MKADDLAEPFVIDTASGVRPIRLSSRRQLSFANTNKDAVSQLSVIFRSDDL